MFSNASVKRLLHYRKSNGSIQDNYPEAQWCEKAVRNLAKKLNSSKLNMLENILSQKNPASACITIPSR